MGKIIQDQILGMKWLNALIGKGLSSLGLDTATRWGGSIQFFLYDARSVWTPLPAGAAAFSFSSMTSSRSRSCSVC